MMIECVKGHECRDHPSSCVIIVGEVWGLLSCTRWNAMPNPRGGCG